MARPWHQLILIMRPLWKERLIYEITGGRMSAIMCIKPRFGLLSLVKCTQAMTICVWLVAKSFYWPFTRTVSFILLSKAFGMTRVMHSNRSMMYFLCIITWPDLWHLIGSSGWLSAVYKFCCSVEIISMSSTTWKENDLLQDSSNFHSYCGSALW